jgi:RimJ/RimL family protein N-acetyltransferase
MDARLEAAWPLFGLRLQTEHLILRMPTDDDLGPLLQVATAGIHPPGEMPFGVAWTLVEGEAFDRNFLQFNWRTRATFAPEAWDLNMLVELDGRPIGAQSVAAEEFAIHRTVHTGSWLGRKHQGRGFGKEMRAAVLGFAFDGLGAQVAETSAFLDNHASNGVSRALGYEENGLGSLAPEGVARVTQRFRMTAEGWHSRPRPHLTIEGLDGIRDLFGAEEQAGRASRA